MAQDRPGKKLWDREAWRDAGFFWTYLKPHRLVLCAAMAALIGTAMMMLVFFKELGEWIGRVAEGAEGEDLRELSNRAALFLIGLVGAQAFIAFWRIMLFARVSERALARLRRDTFARMIRLPMAALASRRSGELASRLANDIESMRETLVVTLPQFIRHSVILVGGLGYLIWLSPRLAVFGAATIPVVLIMIAMFGARIRRLSRQAQDELASSQVVVDESLQAIVSVKAFCNESFETGRYNTRMDRFVATAVRSAKPRALFIAFIIFCFSTALVAVVWFAGTLVADSSIEATELAPFGIMAGLVAASFMQFSELVTQIQRTLGATERVREILADDIEQVGDPAPADASHSLRGDISMEGVCFAYPSRPDAPVLRDFNLEVKAGQRVALVGPSGSGKTTTVSLLLRFYEPSSGLIQFDGRPAREIPLGLLRRNMALVPQEVLLFGGTVMENIAYGRPGASQEQILEASRLANAHEFIERLPQGYDTLVGERGAQLSGGQRQRIAIARAILADPSILILDEATSSLDAESERLVQEALDKLMENRTSIIIAHRLSTVRRCDQILVLSGGTVIEQGRHEDLVATPRSLYATLARLQLE
jgi:ATP-binding cassette subfamily B protein